METEKTKLLISTERQKVLEREAETSKKQAIIKAQADAEISKIVKEKEILEQESKMKIADIQNQMNFNAAKSQADSEFYKQTKEIDANEKRLTENYLKYVWLQSLANNTKIYFGESIPKYMSTNHLDEMKKSIK